MTTTESSIRTYEVEIGGKPLLIQHGALAGLANGAVTVRQGDTVVLVTACMADPREGIDFFPSPSTTKSASTPWGKIPGGFPRREGRPSSDGILAMRLTDRSPAPSSPRASATRSRSSRRPCRPTASTSPTPSLPSAPAPPSASATSPSRPVSSVRVALVDGEYVVNPTFAEAAEATST